jgi:hypothetical protein
MLTRRVGLRWGQLAWALFAVSFVAGACGKEDDSPPTTTGGTGIPGTGGRPFFGNGGAAGNGASGPAGEGGMAGETEPSGGAAGGGEVTEPDDPYAPTVRVTSPKAVTDPNDPNVIVDDELDALCTAVRSTLRGSAPVDTASVLLSMLDAEGRTIETAPGVPTDNQDEYSAHFITRKVADNGRISFTCAAAESSQVGRIGQDRVDSFVDHGPAITPLNPPVSAAGSPVFATAVGEALNVTFTVAEAPVAKGDDGARVEGVTLTVGGKPFEPVLSNGKYTATVHLDDMKIFSPTPDGDQKIVITATNRRAPAAATSQLAYDFLVDGTGPTIKIVSPEAGDVKSGKVQFVIEIEDSQSGVDPDSVVATINNEDYAYSASDPSWSYDPASNTFTFNFDTTQIQNSVAQATLHVAAADNVKNRSTKSVTMQLDNVPPIVDLDPAPVRELKVENPANHCSNAFDPVGPAAASDLEVVHDFHTFRSLVWEETNHAVDQHTGIAAGADLSSVVLYLQPNVAQGLLKDTNDDGFCDALETQDADSGDDLPSLPMHSIAPQGNAYFGTADDDALASEFPLPVGDCEYESSALPPPDALCPPAKNSDMTRVISWDIDHTVPAIFGLDPIAGMTCTGYGWEISAVVPEGWLCAAATAKDNNGNVGISAPIRLCYDDGVDPPPSCLGSDGLADAASAPSCVEKKCKLPPRFGPALLTP